MSTTKTTVITLLAEGHLAQTIQSSLPADYPVVLHEVEAAVVDLGGGELPLSVERSRELMNGEGFLSVLVTVSQDMFMEQHTIGAQTESADDEMDFVHSLVFDFGVPHEVSLEIVAAYDSLFVVSYCTNIGVAIAALGEQEEGR